MVIDIIDQHQPFKNQWNKRRMFYRKQNYKIVMMNDQGVGKEISNYNDHNDTNDTNDTNEKTSINQKKCLIDIDTLDFTK